ncbi:hypothetical protein THRCLA_21656 [Thraustotheca clavata]|uniref:WW domain-containing protein n=1 Tax=Thraustotheca clavata TaxID=74557 RepID=A0A1V9ZRY2_9STRA|nr:hypothetical protein THRCLA_21656 [Thraustotheca clavata]
MINVSSKDDSTQNSRRFCLLTRLADGNEELMSLPARAPTLFQAVTTESELPCKVLTSSHSFSMLQRLGSSKGKETSIPHTPRTSALVRKFNFAGNNLGGEIHVRNNTGSHTQLLPHLKDRNLCADDVIIASPHVKKVRSIWSQEVVACPTQWLYSKQEQYEHVLCRQCNAYLKQEFVEPLPDTWLELSPDGDDKTCFYCNTTNQVLWEPPEGVSKIALRVFQTNGSVFAVCCCRMTWERRHHLLRKVKLYANRYKENVHWLVSTELENVWDRNFNVRLEDNPCQLRN